MINAIFAVDAAGGLGFNGSLPWPKNSEDLRWFKATTTGHIVVMGRRTWDDPMMPKPLPNRVNCVITNHPVDNPLVLTLSGDWLKQIKILSWQVTHQDIFIIGGKDILLQCRPILDKIYLTKINATYECDVTIDVDSYLEGFECTTSTPTTAGTFTIYQHEKLSRSVTDNP